MAALDTELTRCIRCEVAIHTTKACYDATLMYCVICFGEYQEYREENFKFSATVQLSPSHQPAQSDGKLSRYFSMQKYGTSAAAEEERIDLTNLASNLAFDKKGIEIRTNPHAPAIPMS